MPPAAESATIDRANHPLVLAALEHFTSDRTNGKALQIDPKTETVLPVTPHASGGYIWTKARARTQMDRKFRWFAKESQTASDASGVHQLFLASNLRLWKKAGASDATARLAPTRLTPVRCDFETQTFHVVGEPVENDSLRLQIEDGAVFLKTPDDDRAFIIYMDLVDERKKRLVTVAAENPTPPAAFDVLLGIPTAYQPTPLTDVNRREGYPLDEAQTAALAQALSGKNTLIFGPPGCGKTEVIVEIARSAIADNRKTLIASTANSALNVAKRRLKAHIPDIDRNPLIAFETPSSFTNRPITETPFDLVIIDEASQMDVYDALVVAGRGQQIAIVGDPMQMQPKGDRPDLYSLAKERGLPETMLTRHYRSRHEDLIFFSNVTCYERKLKTVPFPIAEKRHGVDLHVARINRRTKRENGISADEEADLVAKRLLEHAQSDDTRSIAVVTISAAQRTAINEAITRVFGTAGIAKNTLTKNPLEPFEVLLPHQAQGAEWDIVLFSAGYSPGKDLIVKTPNAPNRLLSKRPFNQFNVALSRARSRTEVFVQFAPSHIKRNPPSSVDQAIIIFAMIYNMLANAGGAFQVSTAIEALINPGRQPGDVLENLGLIHAWRPAGSKTWPLGILLRSNKRTKAEWDRIADQLRVAGWNLLDVGHEELTYEFDAFQKRAAYEMVKSIDNASKISTQTLMSA